jgi:hypothetical protein
MTLKTIAIAANLGLLGVVLYALTQYGTPSGDDQLMVLMMVVAPVLSIITLVRIEQPSSDEESTANLARKALRAKLKKAADE